LSGDAAGEFTFVGGESPAAEQLVDYVDERPP
jgi:hypothetical protein